MFWCDPVSEKIMTAWMDGQNEAVLVSTNIVEPTGIAIDYFMNSRIFWADGKKNTIESCNWDGSDRAVVLDHGTIITFVWLTKCCPQNVGHFVSDKLVVLDHCLISFGWLEMSTGSLFTKRWDVLPPNLMKSRRDEIRWYNDRIALKFDCQISERMEKSKPESRGIESSWDLPVRHLTT